MQALFFCHCTHGIVVMFNEGCFYQSLADSFPTFCLDVELFLQKPESGQNSTSVVNPIYSGRLLRFCLLVFFCELMWGNESDFMTRCRGSETSSTLNPQHIFFINGTQFRCQGGLQS